MQAKTLIYLHIHHTASKKVMGVLQEQYGGGYRCVDSQAPDLSGEFNCVAGHMAFGLHRLMPQTAIYAAMVRNPIDRVFALYSRMMACPQHVKVGAFSSLSEFVRARVVADTDNGMTRILSGMAYGVMAPGDHVTQHDYETAVKNIDAWFGFVGLFERLEDSLLRMAGIWGWDTAVYEGTQITTHHREREVTAETLEVFRQHNRYDLMLYDYVTSKFWGGIRDGKS